MQVVDLVISSAGNDSTKFSIKNVYITSKLNLPVKSFTMSYMLERYPNVKRKMIAMLFKRPSGRT